MPQRHENRRCAAPLLDLRWATMARTCCSRTPGTNATRRVRLLAPPFSIVGSYKGLPSPLSSFDTRSTVPLERPLEPIPALLARCPARPAPSGCSRCLCARASPPRACSRRTQWGTPPAPGGVGVHAGRVRGRRSAACKDPRYRRVVLARPPRVVATSPPAQGSLSPPQRVRGLLSLPSTSRPCALLDDMARAQATCRART